MKISAVDYIWAVCSVIIMCISFHYNHLGIGIIVVYVLMSAIFVRHILSVKKRMDTSIASFATITGYTQSKTGKFFYPKVKYETETGREINSVYTYTDRQKRYEIGDEEMICYFPDDPVSFYFAGRKEELTEDYFRYIIFGGVLCAILFIIFEIILKN